MDAQTFQSLPTDSVARLVSQAGDKVVVFPINGTRRWFLLEHAPRPEEDWLATYLEVAGQRHIELYRLFFDHGLRTLVTPVFGPDLLERGGEYMQVFVDGLVRIATGAEFVDFYDTCQVRVRFYGDYRAFFAPTPYAYLSDLFDEAAERTRQHGRFRLFFGVCAQDATETVANLAVSYYAQNGNVPDRETLVRMYYGEDVGPVDLFVGFDKFSAFDMPLISTGNEDLYFTVAPSPYMTQSQLRDILYDHLYARRGGEPDYGAMEADDWQRMRAFYRLNRDRTLGIGTKRGPIWYPRGRVEPPDGA
ncbi:MAG: diterpene synthase [Anaerolineae bacterium]